MNNIKGIKRPDVPWRDIERHLPPEMRVEIIGNADALMRGMKARPDVEQFSNISAREVCTALLCAVLAVRQ